MLDLVCENPRRDNETEIRQMMPEYDPEFEAPRVIVWHNAFARLRFPPDLFCGPYDTHCGLVDEVTQGVTFEGQLLPDGLKIFKPRPQSR